ncbi:MAG: hypothetical protein JJ896_00490 [Rhodothermales bacterium]|nr:hypothetical protein [Rhodothermales bacterium]MBO6778104.1 hypothetical protein [Rhodothermales bacterium]
MSLVLLLELDAGMRRRVRTALEGATHRVIVSDNGPEAARLAGEHLPEIILVGRLERPSELGGLLESLRAHPMTAASPVLFIPQAEDGDLEAFLRNLPSSLEKGRPEWQPRLEGPDLGRLPRAVRDALAQLLGQGRQMTLQARSMDPQKARGLGAAIRETGRLLDRLGLAISQAPVPDSDDEIVTELSVPMITSLQSRATRLGRAYAMYLAIEPLLWRGEPTAYINAVTDAVEALLHESTVAVSLRAEEGTVYLTIIADELYLSDSEINAISAAQRTGEAGYSGRFSQLVDLARMCGGTLRMDTGRARGIKFRLTCPHRVGEPSDGAASRA